MPRPIRSMTWFPGGSHNGALGTADQACMTVQHYTGGCQCGAVRYEVTADLDKTIACNCSRCGKLGSILAFAPAEQFTLLSGEDRLTEYRFNTTSSLISSARCAGSRASRAGRCPTVRRWRPSMFAVSMTSTSRRFRQCTTTAARPDLSRLSCSTSVRPHRYPARPMPTCSARRPATRCGWPTPRW